MPERPAIYLRVSSAEQLEGYSLDAQARALRAYPPVWPKDSPRLHRLAQEQQKAPRQREFSAPGLAKCYNWSNEMVQRECY